MKSCSTKQNCKTKLSSSKIPWIPALVLAILPKCPFCIMAYTGAITLCSGTKMYPNSNSFGAYLTLGLGLFVLICLLLNFRGKRTYWSIGVSALGLGMIIASQFISMNAVHYVIGTFLLLIGIWVNGSFMYFISLAKSKYQRTNIYLFKNLKRL